MCGPIPKCFTDSRLFLLPRRMSVFVPVGAWRASWSRVRTSPPAPMMRARAVRVACRAATRMGGTVVRRTSSVIVPTTTMVGADGVAPSLPAPESCFAILESETGGLLVRDWKRRLRIT